MSEVKKVKVCKKCSNFDVTELKGKVKTKDYTTGCIGRCSAKCPELAGKVYGFLNGEFVACESKEEFFTKIAEIV
jgi:coenzyme F420-reducing hydrogenase gamma subunit